MPFLRVIRDKRGYETTYLMQWYREGHRQRSRILYVFRTPGGVRVGRHALEPEVLRQIELQHPDIAFDWSVVRDNQQIIESPAIDTRRRRPAREESETPPVVAAPVAPVVPVTAAPQAPAASAPRPPSIPAALEGATSVEQIAFLAQWYPLVRERIALRSSDPSRQEALLTLAERLNPAAWADGADIVTALQQASEALERLSQVFAKRRRRPRRRPEAGGPSDAAEPTPSES